MVAYHQPTKGGYPIPMYENTLPMLASGMGYAPMSPKSSQIGSRATLPGRRRASGRLSLDRTEVCLDAGMLSWAAKLTSSLHLIPLSVHNVLPANTSPQRGKRGELGQSKATAAADVTGQYKTIHPHRHGGRPQRTEDRVHLACRTNSFFLRTISRPPPAHFDRARHSKDGTSSSHREAQRRDAKSGSQGAGTKKGYDRC